MRMTVNKIENQNNMTIVKGTTDIGAIKGIWKFNEVPNINEEYFVELNIEELHRNQVLIICDKEVCPMVNLSEDKVSFIGRCEDIDEIYYIRFADDWLEMIEIADNDLGINKGDYISFTQQYNRILIYPY
ncbi:MAG: hypothetical protein PUC12_13955 [Clostridiales bacterium]|nr:hypothetical protein [Clostridiales bacterium]